MSIRLMPTFVSKFLGIHLFYYFDYLSITKKIKSLEICFAKGFHLGNESGLLDAKARKLVKGITFPSLTDYEEKQHFFGK